MTTLLVNYWNLQEQIRHNKVTEGETLRHNVAQESIGSSNVALGYANLAEAVRHNKVLEQRVDYQNQADALRSSSDVIGSATKAYTAMTSATLGAAGGAAFTMRPGSKQTWKAIGSTAAATANTATETMFGGLYWLPGVQAFTSYGNPKA